MRYIKRNKKHTNVCLKHGHYRTIECIAIDSYHDLTEWEKLKIAELKTYHYLDEEGIGCNFTFGGEGTQGFKGIKRIKSVEERTKISESKKRLYADPINRKQLGEAIRQAKSQPEKHKNHCDAQKKRYSNPEERLKAHVSNTQKKRVQQLSIEGVVIAEFASLSYAVQQTGIKNIKQVCHGKRSIAGGYHWKYVE